jgi:hypothetical protein
MKSNYYFTVCFGFEENFPSALGQIRLNISCVGSEFLKRLTDVRGNHQYFVSKNAEWLEQEPNLHINIITKPNETDYKIPCTLGTRVL